MNSKIACCGCAVAACVSLMLVWGGVSWLRRQQVAISVTPSVGEHGTCVVRVESWNPLLAPNAGAGKTVVVRAEPVDLPSARSVDAVLPETSRDRSAYEAQLRLQPAGPWRIRATLYHADGVVYAQREIAVRIE